MVMDCNWLGLTKPCMEFFSFLPTDDGMCCTFNSAKYFDPMLGIQSRYKQRKTYLVCSILVILLCVSSFSKVQVNLYESTVTGTEWG